MQAPARALGIALQSVKVTSGKDFESAFATISRSHTDAVYVIEEPVNINQLGRIVEFTAKNRLPAMYGYREAADAGGLMSYATSWPNLFYRAASYVDKILKGANPGDLPIEQPTKFELVINLKTAKALGLTIPPSLLQRADQVIE
jgi:putative ABC transport system substrate-binding protein